MDTGKMQSDAVQWQEDWCGPDRSNCALRGLVSEEGSDSSSLCALLRKWHKATDCSFQCWVAGASQYEKDYVAKLLGKATAGRYFFEKQLQEAQKKPPEDSTLMPDQTIQMAFKNPVIKGLTLRKRLKPDFVIDPEMMSETIAVRPPTAQVAHPTQQGSGLRYWAPLLHPYPKGLP